MEGNNNRDLDLQHEAAKIANKTVGSAEIQGIPVLETEQGTMLLEVLEKLLRESRVDSLTGLYRPKAFFEEVDRIVSFAKRQDRNYQALVVGIDVIGLKRMNEELGHEGADQVLASLGVLLRENMRDYDLACRWSGDEFVLFILLDMDDNPDPSSVIERIIQKRQEGVNLHVGFSLVEGLDEEKIKEKIKFVIDKMEDIKRKGGVDETGRAVGSGLFVNVDKDLS